MSSGMAALAAVASWGFAADIMHASNVAVTRNTIVQMRMSKRNVVPMQHSMSYK